MGHHLVPEAHREKILVLKSRRNRCSSFLIIIGPITDPEKLHDPIWVSKTVGTHSICPDQSTHYDSRSNRLDLTPSFRSQVFISLQIEIIHQMYLAKLIYRREGNTDVSGVDPKTLRPETA
jgi:hypothetical protein